jgi:hypothetical protein
MEDNRYSHGEVVGNLRQHGNGSRRARRMLDSAGKRPAATEEKDARLPPMLVVFIARYPKSKQLWSLPHIIVSS